VTYWIGGAPAVRRPFSGVLCWHVPVRWYLFAVLAMPFTVLRD
jgi:hypothetical protein